MLSEEQHILIDKFFSGELTAEETQQFKDLLHGDATFRAEVELQQQVINGIGVFGAAQLKTELQDIHKEVQADLQSYKPSTGGGSGLLSAIKWLVTLGALGAAGYYGYNYYKAHTHEIHQQLEQLDQVGQPPAPSAPPNGVSYVRRDTVWHTIKVTGTDTVIYGEKELEGYVKKNKGANQVIIRRDTITSLHTAE